MNTWRFVEEPVGNMAAYGSIPIGFEISSRIRVGELVRSGGKDLTEEPAPRRWKDYDLCEEDRPDVLVRRFDTSSWGVLAAQSGDARIGGALLAWNCPGYEMLGGRTDLAAIVDLRVHPDWRGRGVGRALFLAATDWVRARGCRALLVETQDTNVAACRFYAAMGCGLDSVDPEGYGPQVDEAKIVWRLELAIEGQTDILPPA
jgi:GNAT superfamily N-acetyltransferase